MSNVHLVYRRQHAELLILHDIENDTARNKHREWTTGTRLVLLPSPRNCHPRGLATPALLNTKAQTSLHWIRTNFLQIAMICLSNPTI